MPYGMDSPESDAREAQTAGWVDVRQVDWYLDRIKGRLGFQWGLIVASRSQLGLPA